MPDLRLVNVPGTGALIYGDQGSGTRAAADFILFEKNNSEVFSVDSGGLPDPGGNQASRIYTAQIGDIPASGDAFDYFLWEARASVTITKIEYCVDTDTADGSTNRQTLLISDESANQVTTIATPTANPSVVAATWTDMDGGLTNNTLAAGESIFFTPTAITAGIIMSGLTFQITYTMDA